jgi:hypothetical protein
MVLIEDIDVGTRKMASVRVERGGLVAPPTRSR